MNVPSASRGTSLIPPLKMSTPAAAETAERVRNPHLASDRSAVLKSHIPLGRRTARTMASMNMVATFALLMPARFMKSGQIPKNAPEEIALYQSPPIVSSTNKSDRINSISQTKTAISGFFKISLINFIFETP